MDNEMIATYLLRKRKEKGITQTELAKEMGVTFQAVSRWEKGDSIPDIDSLNNLANFYNVSIDEILQRKTAEKSNKNLYSELVFMMIFIVSIFFSILANMGVSLLVTPGGIELYGYLLTIVPLFILIVIPISYYSKQSNKDKNDLHWLMMCYKTFIVLFALVLISDYSAIDYRLHGLIYLFIIVVIKYIEFFIKRHFAYVKSSFIKYEITVFSRLDLVILVLFFLLTSIALIFTIGSLQFITGILMFVYFMFNSKK